MYDAKQFAARPEWMVKVHFSLLASDFRRKGLTESHRIGMEIPFSEKSKNHTQKRHKKPVGKGGIGHSALPV